MECRACDPNPFTCWGTHLEKWIKAFVSAAYYSNLHNMSLALHKFRNKHIFWNDVGDKLQYADAVCSLTNYQRGHFKIQCKESWRHAEIFHFLSMISFIKAADLNNWVVFIQHVIIYENLKIQTKDSNTQILLVSLF